ncbi:glycosyltransferase [Candidatus Parcubacteria bacterium]|nr:MAG: glycosyltransferase [Candidatus Parcubacteria bacterium]
MKVLQVYKDYYPPVKGGIEGHINVLATGLKEHGIDVEVLVSNTSAKFEMKNVEGIAVTKVPQVGRFASASLNLTFSYWINKLGQSADLLHFHFPNPTAEISFLISGLEKPIVVTYHSDIIRQARLLKFYAPLLKKFLGQAKRIIVTSPNYLESSPFLFQFKGKCRFVPFGIDLSDFSGEKRFEKIDEIRNRHSRPILLFIGRFRYYKGLHVLIDAMSDIDAELLIIGGGPLENRLRIHAMNNGLGNKVNFLGELSDAEKIAYLHASDIFVLPSVFRSEAFGIVQLEAMACSKPIVCTELGTGTSFVNQHQETGLVVPPGNSKALADAINLLIDHPKLREQYGKAGFHRARFLFSKERMVDEVISVYREVLELKSISITSGHALSETKKKIKVLRIISRLNIGGPAIHAFLLTKGLNPDRFETILVTGRKSTFEGDMSYLFDSLQNKPLVVEDLQRELSPLRDLRAFIAIVRIIYKEKPDIVHTHTTKAGASARFAVFLFRCFNHKEIKTIHTFHGHVFFGYFNKFMSHMVVWIERFLMKLTDTIIAISDSQYKELTGKYRIAPSYKVVTKELGFDLSPFLRSKSNGGEIRTKLGIGENTSLIGIIGRLVPIKNHKLFLEAAKSFISKNPIERIKFIIVGDGELKSDLMLLTKELELEEAVHFFGWVRDVSVVYSDLDILALTSLNEGTPVSVIEAMASRVPVISTDAGGVVDLVGPEERYSKSNGFKACERGILCAKDDPDGFAGAIKYLIDLNPEEKESLVNRACSFVSEKYTQERLIRNMEDLYIDLLGMK